MALFLSTTLQRRLFSPAGHAGQPSISHILRGQITPKSGFSSFRLRSTNVLPLAAPSPIWQSPIRKALFRSGQQRSISFFAKGCAAAGVGLGLAAFYRGPIECDAPQSTENLDPIYPDDRLPPPVSSVSLYELGFGTVAGICAGVFVKKGAKAVAWFLGGIFVLLQYLGSASLVRVDWGKAAAKFENLFYTKDAAGGTKPPNVLSLWNWMINFLTADFQPRASFVAGFVLGLRIG